MKNPATEMHTAGGLQRRRRWRFITGSLITVLLMLCCAMLLLGNTIYPLSVVIRTLAGEDIQGASFAINTIRLPRMLAGLFAGFAFGIGGNTFQTMLRNPLANPNVIGITTGSSAAAVFCILILQSSEAVVSIASIIAGLATVLFVYLFSYGNSFSIGRIILVGIGIQAMLNALISYLLLIGDQQDIASALRWLTGSLNGAQMYELSPLVICVLIFVPIIIALGKQLTILELGEATAKSLGVNTNRTRITLIVSAVLILSLATALTGPIAFVAFLAGPIAKRLVGGAGYTSQIPAGLIGACLVLSSDLIGQFAFDVRYPVGIITGLIGAPYLIYLLIRMNQKGEL